MSEEETAGGIAKNGEILGGTEAAQAAAEPPPGAPLATSMPMKCPGKRQTLSLKKPQPEVLLARAVPVAADQNHNERPCPLLAAPKMERPASVVGFGLERAVALDLEFEESAWRSRRCTSPT